MLNRLPTSLLLLSLLTPSLLNVATAADNAQALAVANNKQLYLESLDSAPSQALNRQARAATDPYYYNNDKSKVELLFGKWQVTVQAPQPFSASLEIDYTFVDSIFGHYGWDSKSQRSCYYDPTDKLKSGYNYQCLHTLDANAKTAERFLFNVTGNTLTGKYHSGTSSDFITKLNANQLTPFKGTNPNAVLDPVFNDLTGELLIPKVNAYGKVYSVQMKREANGQFTLKSAEPL